MPWAWIALGACAPDRSLHESPRSTGQSPPASAPDTPADDTVTDEGGCPGVSPLDWVDGIDEDGLGGTDGMVVRRADGWHLSFPAGPYGFSTQQPSVGWSSASVDVEGDGRVDWFVASSSGSPAYGYEASTALDGLFRIDDVRTSCTRDLATEVPFLWAPDLARVDRWEDVTGDGVPELLVTATHYDGWDNAALDLYLVDPTTTGASAAIADLAIGHVGVTRGDAGTVADFDGDGHPEVVYLDSDRRLLVFLGEIPPDGEAPVPEAEVATSDRIDSLGSAVAGDLNGDGSADLGLSYFENGVSVGEDEYALGTVVKRVLYGGPDLGATALDDAFEVDDPYATWVRMADFDGDGLDDVATCCSEVGRGGPAPFDMEVRYGDPAGLSATADLVIRVPTLWGLPSVADVDGGGLPDLLLDHFYVDPLAGPYEQLAFTDESQGGVLYRGEDGFAAPALVLDVEVEGFWSEAHDLAAWGPLVDVDLDGYPDILVRNLQWENADHSVDNELSMNVLWGGPVP